MININPIPTNDELCEECQKCAHLKYCPDIAPHNGRYCSHFKKIIGNISTDKESRNADQIIDLLNKNNKLLQELLDINIRTFYIIEKILNER